ncbi:organic cation transporter protein isoform X2 [Odontomachus brunneus]|uniref:organic cation transporter protein isoform X2 n=1 Tax=Odontomachus brunneus TaxID=486640 RepID=UPI0013F1A009|nr:organic cation transporter protein isoform X2 [Odontomachus brunneus]XP_032687665.1 organic cation transporter protein isoform X2 [Odontomachus brunneus]
MASVDRDLEELMSYMGEFGKYQFGQYCLHLLGALLAGLHMLSLLTVAAVPPHQCNIPGANLSSSPWVSNSLGTFDNNSSLTSEYLPRAIDSCHYLDQNNVTRECDSWTYDTTYFQSSRAMEWNFVCSQRWMGSLAQSTYMIGVFAGSLSLGSLADTYGRKIVFYVSAVAQLVLGVSVALMNNYYVFLTLRFLYGIFGSAGAYITGFVLTMEMVGPSRRTVCGVLFQLAFAAGFMLVAAWGVVIKDRMWLQIVYGAHSLLLIGHWWLMDESPRWLWAHDRASEAIIIVQRALKVNGSDVKMDAAKLVGRARAQQETKTDKSSHGTLDLFRTPNLRKKSLIVCLNWFANSIVYYGLSLNMGNLVGNPFVMLFLSGLVELPAYVLVIFTMDRTGKRCLGSTLLLIGGACCICAANIPAASEIASTITVTIVMIGKACVAGSFAVVYNYTAELFPTVVRNTALGIGSMCARLSGALTPMIFLLDSLNPKVPAVLFGVVALVAGFLALYLPETLNQPMPESIEDGENFGRTNSPECLRPVLTAVRTYGGTCVSS